MKVIFDGSAEDATRTIFDLIRQELDIIGWEGKRMVLFEIEKKISRFLKTQIPLDEARRKAIELVDIIRKNKDA